MLTAFDAHGLERLDGEDGNADIKQNADELLSMFKPGKPLIFQAVVKAMVTPEATVEMAGIAGSGAVAAADAETEAQSEPAVESA